MAYVAACFGPEGFGNYQVDWSSDTVTFERVARAPEAILIPGFVDLHFHGAFGIDFMSASAEDMGVLCKRLEACGYELFLPTTVTASAADVKAALKNLPDHPMIGGFHLEGPFISPVFPGAQPPSRIVPPPPVPSEWDEILEDPRLRVVTLAPEVPHALPLIARLFQRDVIVSMGHTNATYDEARFGYEFGARHTTHTYNAMRGLHHREAGMLGYALVQDGLTCELIYDRLHVSKEAAQILLKNKPANRVIAVSDSTLATGMPSGLSLNMWGHECVTHRGSVRLKANDALAGSAITLLEAFTNLAEDFGVETAIRLCCLNPRAALGIKGSPRVLVDLDLKYQVIGRRELA